MGKKYLIDTNILIYYLENQIPTDKIERVEEVLENSFAISVISEIELLSYASLDSADLNTIKTFLAEAEIFPVDATIVEQVAEIRRKHKIKLPDAIIGATAKIQSRTLLSRNTKDFEKIEDLEVENPID